MKRLVNERNVSHAQGNVYFAIMTVPESNVILTVLDFTIDPLISLVGMHIHPNRLDK
jgi:hypothetical protein